MSLYFIAILPDEGTAERVTGFKQLIAERWGPRHAFRSPPHLTLIPPFQRAAAHLSMLEQALQIFAAHQTPFDVELSGFAAFPPRVIFVNPVENPELSHLFEALKHHLAEALEYQDSRNNRPFHPHMTIAHRDVDPKQFRDIWEYFHDKPFNARFTVDKMVLLKLATEKWSVWKRFPFSGLVS